MAYSEGGMLVWVPTFHSPIFFHIKRAELNMLPEKQGYQSTTTQSESFHDKPLRCFRSHSSCLHGFWIHLSMFWEQTNQVFLGIGHTVQIFLCPFWKQRQQLPGSRMIFLQQHETRTSPFCCYHLGPLNCSSSICDCKSPRSIDGCKSPALQTSKHLGWIVKGYLENGAAFATEGLYSGSLEIVPSRIACCLPFPRHQFWRPYQPCKRYLSTFGWPFMGKCR